MRVASPIVLVAALLLSVLPAATSAQSTSYPPTLRVNCSSGPSGSPPCPITILVGASCGSGIRVAPDPIVVRAGDEVRIKWNITGNWEFANADGIYIHQAPEKAFTEPTRASDGMSFTLRFQNRQPGTYKYDINLKRGTETCRIDPIIVNW